MLREDEDIAYRVAAVVRLADGETSKASRLKLAGGWPFMIVDVSGYGLLGASWTRPLFL